jgi:hypothetical protein
VILAASLLLAGALAVALGHPQLVPGLVAGGLLGLANLAWLVAGARRLIGHAPRRPVLQMAAATRLAGMAALFGALLIWGHLNPIGVVVGYGLFPFAMAAAGFYALGPAPARSG